MLNNAPPPFQTPIQPLNEMQNKPTPYQSQTPSDCQETLLPFETDKGNTNADLKHSPIHRKRT